MSFIQCWSCVGNGIINYPNEPLRRCEDCGGTGCDIEKTKQIIPEHERTIPSPLPPFEYELKEKNNHGTKTRHNKKV